ncbi:unnamed protein product [Phytophthora fragariaefolia]|uniref:Unnamed protein product n=1 Tax=Phytophthora fragariaefolia TaxID=1490495 RepID=A0A9W6X5H8_9STRA|nr:unnamed protein product [Phytophthora fragariaefolia]
MKRVAQLRAATSGSPSCLPTALLALTKSHVQEVRLDSGAQFSIVGIELRRYCHCITRRAPVDIIEGFGGGIKVLGVWRFTGTTQYQQRITVDDLLVDGQGDEFLIGEDWIMKKQIKMDFGSRELNAVVRLARTAKLATNTRSVIRVPVEAADGTTGVFLPKPSSKRHLMMAPTVDTVRNGLVCIAVLNVEGRREKLPAREALGKWIPTDTEMEILSANGELDRARVASWIATLRKEDAAPLRDEDKLDIGEMEADDRD